MATQRRESREDRARQAALYHANIIQHQKDAELRILEALETLLELPSSKQSDPARPSTQDVWVLKEALALFQPSNYDALIEERNINRLCGYALCPHPNKLLGTNANRIIVQDRGRVWDPLKTVDKKALEQWCSAECGKRALYLKVQMNEKPVWERSGTTVNDIALLDVIDLQQSEKGSKNMNEASLSAAMQALAIERGHSNTQDVPFRPPDINVTENHNLHDITQPSQQSLPNIASYHDSIEGYRPRGASGKARPEPTKEDSGDDSDVNDLSGMLSGF